MINMGKVTIKSPSSDEIWDIWKNKNAGNRKFQKLYGVKGAAFDLDKVTAAEFVQGIDKGAILFYKKVTKSGASTAKGEKMQKKPSKVARTNFYEFKSGDIDKSNWKGDDEVPHLSTLSQTVCSKCKGTGGMKCSKCDGSGYHGCPKCKVGQIECKECMGSGKLEIDITTINETGGKSKISKSVNCNKCFGKKTIVCDLCGGSTQVYCKTCTGTGRTICPECEGYGYIFTYQVLPVPFKSVSSSDIVMLSSERLGKEVEREIGKELEQAIQNLGTIEINSENDLNKKNINANLGYLDKNVWKIVKTASKDISAAEKADDEKVIFPLYLIPMITLHCTSNKRKSYDVFALGTDDKFRVFGEV